MPRAALVGLLAGSVAVAFRYTLDIAQRWRINLISTAHHFGYAGILLPMIYGAAGGYIAVRLVRRYAPEASGSGIPHLKAVLHRLRGMQWQRILPVKFIGGVVGIGGGLALGREGPTVQMGGAVGQMVAGWLKSTPRERQTLIAAGAGAGLAAAFNAPLSGLVFVLEEVQRDFTPTIFTATFVACVMADLVTRLSLNQRPVFQVAAFPLQPLSALPLFCLLGIICGAMGVIFNRALLASLRFFERGRSWPVGMTGAAIGAMVGLAGWFHPDVLGSGQALVQRTLVGDMTLATLPTLFLLRFALTMGSYASGAPGGIFAPLLVLGTQIGLLVGLLAQHSFTSIVSDPAAFAVVGMAAYFTAIVRAPLTGIVLIIEMTGDYNLMLPLLVACFAAYGIADMCRDRPIYEALLERDLLRSQEKPELDGTLLLELSVLAGAPFEGKSIGELDLPGGCLVITVTRGLKNEVAAAELRLQAGDRITALIAPEAADAAALLRHGTSG